MANRKEEILIVALHLFARDGYEAVSVSQIAGALGITKGALYRHFKSKRDIFDCIVQRMEQGDSEQAADDGRKIPIMTMGPICIKNEFKGKGYGKMLLDYSLEKAANFGCGALCFEGNIDFYGKSGFKQASEFGIRYYGLPEGEDASFFLCKELIPGYLDGGTGNIPHRKDIWWTKEKQKNLINSFHIRRKRKCQGRYFKFVGKKGSFFAM